MQMLSLNMGDPRRAALPEPPSPESLESAVLSLRRHGAVTGPPGQEVAYTMMAHDDDT